MIDQKNGKQKASSYLTSHLSNCWLPAYSVFIFHDSYLLGSYFTGPSDSPPSRAVIFAGIGFILTVSYYLFQEVSVPLACIYNNTEFIQCQQFLDN